MKLGDTDRELLRLAIPAVGALVAEPLYLLADTAHSLWGLARGFGSWLARTGGDDGDRVLMSLVDLGRARACLALKWQSKQ